VSEFVALVKKHREETGCGVQEAKKVIRKKYPRFRRPVSDLSNSLRYHDVDHLSGVVTDIVYGSKLEEAANKLDELEDELSTAREELAELKDKQKVEIWCCGTARASRGWNHSTECENWTVGF
jgi:vacuolar-type H+-ATPase subunit I/STV1